MAVGVGGAIGTLARYGVESAVPPRLEQVPWATLSINLGGSLLLGVVLYVAFERGPPSRLMRPFLAIGVLGGFTTFSTFMVEVVQRVGPRPAIATAYLAASVVGGPIAVLAGAATMRRIDARAPRMRHKEQKDE